MKLKTKISTLCALIFILLGAWAFWLEPASVRVVEYKLSPHQWPRSCEGLRVAVLADLHVGSPFNDLAQLSHIVELTNHAKPDIILLAGDYVIQGVVGGTFIAPEAAAKILAKLQARAGVYAVLGNHDWWLDPERVARALKDNHIQVLEDANTAIDIQLATPIRTQNQCRFYLAGISDYWEGAHDIVKALAMIPEQATTLAFTHNPDLFPHVPEQLALTIAGHTHGGQVYLPLLGRLIVPSAFGETYAIGAIEQQGVLNTKFLFVSPGIGTSILPVRFLVPPEISVLTLSSATQSHQP